MMSALFCLTVITQSVSSYTDALSAQVLVFFSSLSSACLWSYFNRIFACIIYLDKTYSYSKLNEIVYSDLYSMKYIQMIFS